MLQICELSIRFGKGPEVSSDVSFTINDRDRFVLIGETGSGKSVLMLAALGLLPRTAVTTGQIFYNEKELLSASKQELNQLLGIKISYIPQGSGNGLNPLLTIGRQMDEMISRRKKLPKSELEAASSKFLEAFGFPEPRRLRRAFPFMLSGGMRQRVLIAMAAAADAELILADEPTKGLDSGRISLVADSFRTLYDRTVFCVTHDIRFAKEIGTKIAVAYASQIVEIASKDDFFNKPLHPYAQAMTAALPENGFQVQSGFAPPRSEDTETGCRFISRCSYKNQKCHKMPPLTDLGSRKVRCWLHAD